VNESTIVVLGCSPVLREGVTGRGSNTSVELRPASSMKRNNGGFRADLDFRLLSARLTYSAHAASLCQD
jgi:hypothetical protein